MQAYSISPEALKAISKKTMKRVLPVMFLAAIIGLASSMLGKNGTFVFEPTTFLVVPVILLFLGFSLYRGINKQQKILASYRLTIEGNVITREQLNTEEVTIYFHEIKEIIKARNGILTIKGFDKSDVIYVPVQIDNMDKLEAFLSDIKPITIPDATASRIQNLKPLLMLVVLGLMITVNVSFNKIVVSIAALLFTAAVIWYMVQLRANKNVDNKTKNRSWTLILAIVFVIGVALFKVFGLGI